MKISYITNYDSQDIHSWSGTGYKIAQSLQQQNNEIDFISNLKYKANLSIVLKYGFNKIFKNSYDRFREPYVVKQYAKQILERLKPDADVLFSPGTLPISLLDSKKPKVFYTDATFVGMLDFYPAFTGLSRESIRIGNYLDQCALDSSTLAIFSSEWAAQTAIDFYSADPKKIQVIPFGANLSSKKSFQEIQHIISKRSKIECNILFMAVQWNRKGGELALNIVRKLNILGLKTNLHIVGFKKLPIEKIPEYVINHGYISKSTKEGLDKIENLLSKCHFLLLPTQADCTPIVYSEANSFGLPCISTNVGGIPTIIKDEINGKLFSLNDNLDVYAAYIYAVFCNEKRYTDLCKSSFNEFQTRLNWDVAGSSIMKLLNQI